MTMSPQMVAVLPTNLKLNNRMQILEIFKGGGEYTVNHIVDKIGISRQTVMKAIQFFMEKGLIVSCGKADSTNVGGKRPELFTLSPEKYLLCISLWPDKLNITLLNFRSDIIESVERKEPISRNISTVIQIVGESVSSLLNHNRLSLEQLLCVNVSTSGIIDYRTNTLKYNSLVPEWGSDIPIADYLQPYFLKDTPILLENVAKVVGRSILTEDVLQDKRILTLFSSWGGVCSCFVEKGRILNGQNSLIGEIGHMILEPSDSEVCGCGSHGCFELLVSNNRLRQNIAKSLGKYPNSVLNQASLDTLTIETVFSASRQSDTFARKLVSQLAHYFALALRNITLAFDPELVVFQGEYASADTYFCTELQRCLSEFQYYPSGFPFTLRLDQHPIQNLNTSGGYTLMLEYLFSNSALYK